MGTGREFSDLLTAVLNFAGEHDRCDMHHSGLSECLLYIVVCQKFRFFMLTYRL